MFTLLKFNSSTDVNKARDILSKEIKRAKERRLLSNDDHSGNHRAYIEGPCFWRAENFRPGFAAAPKTHQIYQDSILVNAYQLKDELALSCLGARR